MSYQEAWWANDASPARLNSQRGTHRRQGEHRGFLWEAGAGGRWLCPEMEGARRLGAASSQALLAPGFKRLAGCYMHAA